MSWFAAHQTQIYALMVTITFVMIAKKGIPHIDRSKKKERGGPFARWVAFGCYVVAGVALTVAVTPIVTALVSWGGGDGLGAIVGNVGAVIALALGWQAIAMTISVARDLFDKTPDHEARSGALWIPTFAPIGGAAVAQVVKNPQGLGQGITAAVMGVVTLVYVYQIIKRMDAAKNHKDVWNWLAFAVCVLGGLVLIPLIAYTDTVLSGILPGVLMGFIRVGAGLAGLFLLFIGAYDIVCDGEPNNKARAAAIGGVGITFVLGGIAIGAITGSWADGAGFLNGMF